MTPADKQLQYMQDFLVEIAKGNFDSKLNISNDSNEELVAMQVGINMLVEELKSTTISRVFLNSIYDGINDILIVLNENGEIQNINHLTETILSYQESELLHKSIKKIMQPDDFENFKKHIKRIYENKINLQFGLNLIAKNKSIIPVSCSLSVIYNNERIPFGILLVAKNISALLEAKNELQNKNDELNLFVYKASHDLKAPVSSLMGIMNLLNKSEDMQEIKMYCKMIDDCTKKMSTIISDLLILGKVTYADLKYEPINIKNTIDDVLNNLKLQYNPENITFNILIDKDVKFIKTEKELFYTIVFNLVDNAIKYRQQESKISYININVSSSDKGISFTIEDNGIGIEQELQQNIFKMFYRATYASKGSGLGLYIVKTSVLKLGGSICFKSIIDRGTTFKLYLPSY